MDMKRAEAERLLRILIGQRFRVAEESWAVVGGNFEHNQLRIDMSTTKNLSVHLEIPRTFDHAKRDDMAWLVAQIEARLRPIDQ